MIPNETTWEDTGLFTTCTISSLTVQNFLFSTNLLHIPPQKGATSLDKLLRSDNAVSRLGVSADDMY